MKTKKDLSPDAVKNFIEGAKTESPKPIKKETEKRINKNFEVFEEQHIDAKSAAAKGKVHLWEVWEFLLSYYLENKDKINKDIIVKRNK